MEKCMNELEKGSTLRSYKPEDEASMLSLWKITFHKEMPLKAWRWKYVENPYGNRMMVWVSEQGQILAMFGGICYRTNWSGKTVEMTHLMDNMSHPDFRGAGMFVRTVQAFVDTYTGPGKSVFLYGFPGQHHFAIGQKYQFYGVLEPGMKYLTFKTGDVTNGKSVDTGRIDAVTTITDVYDELWEKCLKDYPFCAVRDSKFLRWRFFEHPFQKYEIWAYRSRSGEALSGYAVFFMENNRARLIDMLAVQSETEVRRFWRKLGEMFCDRGILEVTAWFPAGHFLADAALSAGFVQAQEPLGFIPTGRTFHPSLSFNWASRNIFYTMADGDLF